MQHLADLESPEISDMFESIVQRRPEAMRRLREKAFEIYALLNELSPLIIEYTRDVCAECKDVCCIDRHSRFARDDYVYLGALGKVPAARKEIIIPDSGPCRFLGQAGCKISHSVRPYRCTWYFCTPLLTRIGEASVSDYRKFVGLLQKITGMRHGLLGEFLEEAKRAQRVGP